MKKLFKITFLFFLTLVSCKEDGPDISFSKEHAKIHLQDEKNATKLVVDSETEIRSKVIKLVEELPEVKDKFEKKAGISILESPKDNGKNYYWVNFYEDNSIFFKTEYDFFVYQNSFEIKYYDRKNKKIYSLEEWRN
jgi:hypothetical protein